MKNLIYFYFALLIYIPSAKADSTRVEWLNSAGTLLGDFFGNPLKAGTSADYDGSRLQLGYYSEATQVTPFQGQWVPLTGYTGDLFSSSIGDKGNLGAGRFNISSSFTTLSTLTLPPSNTPLSIRFYDSFSTSGSVYYNAVTDTTGAWNWISPTPSQSVVTLALANSTLTWEGGTGSAYRTTINVNIPEPTSSCAIAALCVLVFASKRRFITLKTHQRRLVT
jgi:hypothetical protein